MSHYFGKPFKFYYIWETRLDQNGLPVEMSWTAKSEASIVRFIKNRSTDTVFSETTPALILRSDYGVDSLEDVPFGERDMFYDLLVDLFEAHGADALLFYSPFFSEPYQPTNHKLRFQACIEYLKVTCASYKIAAEFEHTDERVVIEGGSSKSLRLVEPDNYSAGIDYSYFK